MDLYYSPEHVERVIRRTKLWNYDSYNMMAKLFSFYEAIKLEDVHPLESGLFRRKYRLDRRAGMPIESPLSFYPPYLGGVVEACPPGGTVLALLAYPQARRARHGVL